MWCVNAHYLARTVTKTVTVLPIERKVAVGQSPLNSNHGSSLSLGVRCLGYTASKHDEKLIKTKIMAPHYRSVHVFMAT